MMSLHFPSVLHTNKQYDSCPSRGTSDRCGPADQTENLPENRHGWRQQVRVRGCSHILSLTSLKNPVVSPPGLPLTLRPAVDAADALSLLEEAEGAPDPLFGVMYMQEPVPSPNTLLQVTRIPRQRGRFNTQAQRLCADETFVLFCLGDESRVPERIVSSASGDESDSKCCCCRER